MFHMQGLGALLQGVSFRTSPSVLAGWSRWQPLSSWPWWPPWPGGWQNHKCHLKIFLVAEFCFLFQYKFTFQNISFFYRFIVSVSLGIGIGIGLLKIHIAASKAELHEITI